MSTRGQLIVFEGPDGVGKTTLANRYADFMRTSGRDVWSTAFPGNEDGTLGKHVHELHHGPARFGVHHMTAASLQMLHVAAHLDAIEMGIRPRIEAGKSVVLDRYWWSTWVYGVESGVGAATLDAMIACELRQWGTLSPAVTLLITRAQPVRTEDAGDAWLTRARLYSELAAREATKYPVRKISNDGSVEQAILEVDRMVRGEPGNERGG